MDKKAKKHFGRVGGNEQQSIWFGHPGDDWRHVSGKRPEDGKYYKCEAIDSINGEWVEATRPKVWDNGLEFMEEFTPEALTAIFTLAQTQVATNIWITTMASASSISSQDLRTIQGMTYLAYEGLITQEEYNQIMGIK